MSRGSSLGRAPRCSSLRVAPLVLVSGATHGHPPRREGKTLPNLARRDSPRDADVPAIRPPPQTKHPARASPCPLSHHDHDACASPSRAPHLAFCAPRRPTWQIRRETPGGPPPFVSHILAVVAGRPRPSASGLPAARLVWRYVLLMSARRPRTVL
ncbi:hypothetical protein FA95DRAFT_1223385 [Auriscalpium vulgare]|uniref:Uncharacterized protein n=1 Tax=Auriscalpium vulgare TaxID=40419 RepID=A0ACB8R2V8_9AGAM|nr:hypothetical protein FA95DRAFT_1223385 [Auriscalpium vulgare]